MPRWILTVVVVAILSTAAHAHGHLAEDMAQVEQFYLRYLGRPIEPSTASNIRHEFSKHHGTVQDIQVSILSSEEYYKRRGQSAPGFVAGLSLDVLDRRASQEMLVYWMDRLDRVSRKTMVREFLDAYRPAAVVVTPPPPPPRVYVEEAPPARVLVPEYRVAPRYVVPVEEVIPVPVYRAVPAYGPVIYPAYPRARMSLNIRF